MSNFLSVLTRCSPAAQSSPPPPAKQELPAPAKQTVTTSTAVPTSLAALPAIAEGSLATAEKAKAEAKMRESKTVSLSMPFAERDSIKNPSVKRTIAIQALAYSKLMQREYRLEADEAKVLAKMEEARRAAIEDQNKLSAKKVKAQNDMADILTGYEESVEILHDLLKQLGLEAVFIKLIPSSIDARALVDTKNSISNKEVFTRMILNMCNNNYVFGVLDQIPPQLQKLKLQEDIMEGILQVFGAYKYYASILRMTTTSSAVIFESLKNILPSQDSAATSEAVIHYHDTIEVKLTPRTSLSLTAEVKAAAPAPAGKDVQVEAGSGTTLPSAIATVSPKKEDRFVTGSFSFDVQGKVVPVEVRAIFDGHGGSACATFAKDKLIAMLNDKLIHYCKSGMNIVSVHQALKEIFPDITREFLKAHPGDTSGSTANACIYFPQTQTLYTVNAGDSCAILVRASEVLSLSKEEKAADPVLKKEIERRGGTVGAMGGAMRIVKEIGNEQFGLIGGRSLGESHFDEAVSARGAVVRYENIQASDVVIQCTDGVTDVADPSLIGSHVQAWMQEPNISMRKIAGRIVAGAALAGSLDDITAMASQFGSASSSSMTSPAVL